ncbi:MAG: hypothetical protein AAFX76_13945 [Planctomycetota bacterium]
MRSRRSFTMRDVLLCGIAAAFGLAAAGCVHAQPGPPAYEPMREVGRVAHPAIDESSGLAASRLNPGYLWTHNDSGDSPRLFLLKPTGELALEYRVDLPRAIDWEDMAAFELDGEHVLLVGDVGDNQARRSRLTLWLIPEPLYDPAQRFIQPPTIGAARKLDFTFADGPQDCESVAFDPVTRTLILVTKVDPRKNLFTTAGVYLWPLPDEDPDEPVVLERAADLTLRITVAADVSPDGSRCVVATYGDAWEYPRKPEETWAQAFAEPPHHVPLGPRGQSEAIAYSHDGGSLFLTAEGVNKPLWGVTRRAAKE